MVERMPYFGLSARSTGLFYKYAEGSSLRVWCLFWPWGYFVRITCTEDLVAESPPTNSSKVPGSATKRMEAS